MRTIYVKTDGTFGIPIEEKRGLVRPTCSVYSFGQILNLVRALEELRKLFIPFPVSVLVHYA